MQISQQFVVILKSKTMIFKANWSLSVFFEFLIRVQKTFKISLSIKTK